MEAPSPGPDAEDARPSSRLFGFLFNRLGRRSISRAPSPSSMPESRQQSESGTNKDRAIRCGWPSKSLQPQEEDEVAQKIEQVLPTPLSAIEPLQQPGEETAARRADETPTDTAPSREFPKVEAVDLQIGGRSNSDNAEWNFRRREVRRNSRSAQEWVRESVTLEPQSDWSESLDAYEHGNDGPPDAASNGAAKEQTSPSRANGHPARFRRRSKSVEELRSGVVNVEKPSQHRRVSNESVRRSCESKRTSFEAGLDQNLAAAGPRRSVEKARRHSRRETSRHSDFLPAELVQRSLLFNSAGKDQD